MSDNFNLLYDQMKDCVMLDKVTSDDTYGGGVKPTYVVGAAFKAAIALNVSIIAKIADKQGVTSLYKVVTPKNVVLDFHDVFQRVEDGKTFRVTSNGQDKTVPDRATIPIRMVTAEEFHI